MPGCWFKGMEEIIRERGLWPDAGGLLIQCPNFKCPPGCADCCCRRILFLQPDFIAQKSQLEELIELRGTFATSTPNTIASSTSSSNIGVQQNLTIANHPERKRDAKWKLPFGRALTVSPFFRSEGEFFFLVECRFTDSPQVRKSSCALHWRLQEGAIGRTSRVGEQEVSRSSHTPS